MSDDLLYPRQLDDQNIRVVELAPGTLGDAITCRLVERPLKSYGGFTALSYVWHSERQDEVICCNGIQHRISANLYDALRCCRESSRTVSLWADALSINQNDLQEKAAQVAMMKEIFDQAEDVFAWLGEDFNNDAQLGMEMLERANECIVSESGRVREISGIPDLKGITKEAFSLEQNEKRRFPLLDTSSGTIKDPYWIALVRLLSRTYFRRTWIIQEVAQQWKVKAAIGFSGVQISWLRLCVACWWFDQKGYFDVIEELIAIRNIVIMCFLGSQNNSLEYVLRWVQYFDCKEPHDKIFSVLGLIGRNHAGDSPHCLQVDYEQKFEKLYRDVTLYNLSHPQEDGSGGIATLHQAFLAPQALVDTRFENLPSWVPRLHGRAFRTWIWGSDSPTEIFNAAGDLAASFHSSDDSPHILSIKGTIVDTVEFASTALDGIHGDSLETWQGMRTLWRKTYTNEAVCDRYMSIDDAFAATVTGGRRRDFQRNSTSTDRFNKHDLSMYWRLAEIAHSKGRWQRFQKHFAFVMYGGRRSEPHAKVTGIDDGIGFSICIRRQQAFIITKRGYMVQGHQDTLPGDLVCIFYGGCWPFILRPERGRFKLVGMCYAHGLMNGEALEDLDIGKLKEEIFDLI